MKKGRAKANMAGPRKLPKPVRKITAEDVANYFLNQVDIESGADQLSNLKIQKLVYYAQGYHLAFFGRPLFDEEIEAWKHGPVVPSLYRKFRDYEAGPVPKPKALNNNLFSDEQRDLLDKVFAYYDQFSALKLRNMTHEEEPWATSYNASSGGAIIPKDLLKKFFLKEIEG